MKKKVLIVDDEIEIRELIKTQLTNFEYEVLTCEDGEDAIKCLETNVVDLVITDIRMPKVTGVELLSHIKSKLNVPVILMTAFADILEVKSAYELGANGFLPKPFTYQELLESLDKILRDQSAPVAKNKIEHFDINDFCKLSIDNFISGKMFPYSVYIQLSQEKIVKIAKTGEDLTLENVNNYKKKGVKFLFLQKSDFIKHVGFSVNVSRKIKESNKFSQEKKQTFLKQTSEILMENLYINEIDKNSFLQAKDFLEVSLSVLIDSEEVFNLLNGLKQFSERLYAHSLAVSVYSVMIAHEMEWKSSQNMFKISLGGIFHDIGKKEIEKSILEKSRAEMSQEERRIYESHVVRGKEILESITMLPTDIVEIVYQHHEKCDGYGFPGSLLKNSIHPLAKLVGLTNYFCNLVLTGDPKKDMSPSQALQRIEEYRSSYDLKTVAALKKLILNDVSKKAA